MRKKRERYSERDKAVEQCKGMSESDHGTEMGAKQPVCRKGLIDET